MTVPDWDVVGGNPAPGEPAAFLQLADTLGTTATNAEDAHRRLRDMASRVDESIWRGKAADAFREKISELPDKLRKLFESYDAASKAMAAYGNTLRDLQAEANDHAADAERAQTDEKSAQSTLDSAVAADPATPTAGHQDAVDAARARLRASREKIDDIRDRRRAAEDRAVDGLGHAGDLGIQNKKWYQKALKFIADAAEVVAIVLAVVAIVVVVVVFLSNPGGWAALAAAFAAAGPLFTAATVASGTALAARTGGKLAGDDSVSWEQIGIDAALFVGTLGAGKALGLFKLKVPGNAVRGGAGPVRVGQQGLNKLGIVQNTTRIPMPGGGYRVPDILDPVGKVIGEVKNVKRLSYTRQLRDYAGYAQANGFQFDLYVRASTKLSGPLQQAVSNGFVNLFRLL